MSSTTFLERMALWKQAFDVVDAELTDEVTRAALRTMQTRQPAEDETAESYLREQLSSAKQVALIVQANRRVAAQVASQLVIGVRQPVEWNAEE